MEQDSSTNSWNQVGQDWCKLAQTNDFRVDYIMPYTFEKLVEVSGKRLLDLGCGEGGYSRELAKRGAYVTSIDCSEYFINYAQSKAEEEGLKIEHHIRNSNDLYGMEDDSFNIVLCSMMLMDCEDLEGTLKEVKRVLKPSGRVFISVLHPCFKGKNIVWQGDETGKKVIVEDYFYPSEWKNFVSGSIETEVVWHHRTLQDYVKAFVRSGLTITDLNEPQPTLEQIKKSPRIAWLQKIPMFLFWELTK